MEKLLLLKLITMESLWVHQINGKFREEYYYSENLTDFAVWEELLEHFSEADALQHVYFIAIDLSYEALDSGKSGGLAGVSFFPCYRRAQRRFF